MSKRIYIALPRDYTHENSCADGDTRIAFLYLEVLGYELVKPDYSDANGLDTTHILLQCDGVLIMPGWDTDPISAHAVTVAKQLGRPVGTYDQWATLLEAGGQ